MTTIRILGPIEVSADGPVLPVGGRRQLKLFALLVLHANRAVSSDVLVDAVWGAGRASSDNRLQMAIARLRKALAPLNEDTGPLLRTVGGGYMLSVGPGELDAEVFATSVHDAQLSLDAGDPQRTRELLAEALSLWRGPPLADVCFEDFAQPEIRRLEELHKVALETQIDAELELGHHAQLVGELEALLAEQPTRERVASQLMLALYRSGRQADALEVYQRTRAHLAEQLGLEPGPVLKAMQSQILQQAPSLEATVSPAHEEDQVNDVIAALRTGNAFLVWRSGNSGPQLLLLLGPDRWRVTIGRDPGADVALAWDAEVSRTHALLERVGPGWTLVDDGLSRNGTFVNGTRVHGRRRLADGDCVRAGAAEIVYREPGSEGGDSSAAITRTSSA